MHGLHKTSTSKGEQKSAIKFHKFPVYQKTEQQGIRSKGSRNETVYIYNRAREFLFASSANNETGKTCFVRRRWKYEDPRSASSNNRTRHVQPVAVPRLPFFPSHKRENRRLQGYKRNYPFPGEPSSAKMKYS